MNQRANHSPIVVFVEYISTVVGCWSCQDASGLGGVEHSQTLPQNSHSPVGSSWSASEMDRFTLHRYSTIFIPRHAKLASYSVGTYI